MKSRSLCLLATLSLAACTSTMPHDVVIATPSLAQAKKAFKQGDYATARQALTLRAIAGDASAQYALAYMYYYGQAGVKNLNLARGWMEIAARSGNKKALMALDMMHAPSLSGIANSTKPLD